MDPFHNIPFQISQGDVDIQMVYPFAAGNRFVHMRDKDHQTDPVDSWMGRSNGHWEGDDLVIVTTDLIADTRTVQSCAVQDTITLAVGNN